MHIIVCYDGTGPSSVLYGCCSVEHYFLDEGYFLLLTPKKIVSGKSVNPANYV